MKNKKILSTILVGALSLSFVGCTSMESKMKDHESNTKGLHRKVTVISNTGEEVKTYESKNMRIQDGDGGTITMDFDGKRVIICNAQVIIEELN